MSFRFHVVVLAVLVTVFAFGSSAVALEKSSSRLTAADERDEWRAGSTSCSIIYYNTCTGWIWVWSSWSPADRYGVHFYRGWANFNANLMNTWLFYAEAAPSGYGFTGQIDVFPADNSGCIVGPALASTPLLPLSSWNQIDFTGAGGVPVPLNFVVSYTAGTPAMQIGDPHSIATDHPAAGPTGPQAAGICYPTTRMNRSYYYGTPSAPLCPGSPLNDGIADALLLIDVQLSYAGIPGGSDCSAHPLAVQESSWGTIKALYR